MYVLEGGYSTAKLNTLVVDTQVVCVQVTDRILKNSVGQTQREIWDSKYGELGCVALYLFHVRGQFQADVRR